VTLIRGLRPLLPGAPRRLWRPGRRSGADDLHVRRGDQPLGRRRLTRPLVRAAALVRVAAFG